MGLVPRVRLTVYPDDCDSYGHLNQAVFLRLFERARWKALAEGPGASSVFGESGLARPVVRSAAVEYEASAFPGEQLEFAANLTQLGRSSFTLYQVARRSEGGETVATGEFAFVCVDPEGRPVSLPPGVAEFFGTRPSGRGWKTSRQFVGDGSLGLEQRGDGPAIVFLHGFPFDRTMWRNQLSALRGWHRIAPDLRGFGLSDSPAGACSMATYARDVTRLLDAIGVGRFVLCGLSMGGYLAFELLRQCPERVRALVLCNTRAEADSEEARRARDTTIELVRTGGAEALADTMMPKLLAPATTVARPDVLAHVRTLICDTDVPGISAALEAMRERPDSTALLPSLRMPALVLAGAKDPLVPPESASGMADAVPGAIFKVTDDAAHLSPLEQPSSVNAAMREFLDTVGPEH